MATYLKWLVLTLTLLSLAGCSGARSLSLATPAQARAELRAGDRVIVETTDGRRLRFTLKRVTAQELVGADVRLPWSEVRTLEVERPHAGKTTGALVVAVLGGVVLLAVLLAETVAKGAAASSSGS